MRMKRMMMMIKKSSRRKQHNMDTMTLLLLLLPAERQTVFWTVRETGRQHVRTWLLTL